MVIHYVSDAGILENGKVGDIAQVPYIVSIMLNNQHICGGSLLNEEIVITACHCLRDQSPPYDREPGRAVDSRALEKYRFVAGTVNIREFDDSVQIRAPKGLFLHPECALTHKGGQNTHIGIAVMKDGFSVATTSVKPVLLFSIDPVKFDSDFYFMVQDRTQPPHCVVPGWKPNSTDGELGITTMNYLPNYPCWSRFFLYNSSIGEFDLDTYQQMCALSATESDCWYSGSPWVCSGYIMAVVTEDECAGQPGVFQRVSSMLEWFSRFCNPDLGCTIGEQRRPFSKSPRPEGFLTATTNLLDLLHMSIILLETSCFF